jgi:hypothetical protein
MLRSPLCPSSFHVTMPCRGSMSVWHHAQRRYVCSSSFLIRRPRAGPVLTECGLTTARQDYDGPLEVSIFDDSSTDGSDACIRSWGEKLQDAGVKVACNGNRWPESPGSDPNAPAGGAGRARNMAVKQSSGAFLCFLDADDIMLPHRVRRQLAAALAHPRAIIGAGFVKEPADATEHYAKWANGLDAAQLWLQHFRELTVLMPTWFFARTVFDRVGAFVEADPTAEGEAEDLIFFHAHIAHELRHLDASTSLHSVARPDGAQHLESHTEGSTPGGKEGETGGATQGRKEDGGHQREGGREGGRARETQGGAEDEGHQQKRPIETPLQQKRPIETPCMVWMCV